MRTFFCIFYYLYNQNLQCMDRCFYDGHNENTVKVTRPDRKYYDIPITPEIYKGDILKFIRPIEKALTKSYYREKKLDQLFNIKRDLCTCIEGFSFYYDYNDGVIEIYDIMIYSGYSVYKSIKNIFNLSDEMTYQKISEVIEKNQEIKVKEFKYLPWKWDKYRIPYN